MSIRCEVETPEIIGKRVLLNAVQLAVIRSNLAFFGQGVVRSVKSEFVAAPTVSAG